MNYQKLWKELKKKLDEKLDQAKSLNVSYEIKHLEWVLLKMGMLEHGIAEQGE